ncbi:MAG: laccase domain-containing protein [Porticoccaceae bacterium]
MTIILSRLRRHLPLVLEDSQSDRLKANLYSLAIAELNACNVSEIYGGDCCTFSEPERFYSYRRDGITGRHASLIWIK